MALIILRRMEFSLYQSTGGRWGRLLCLVQRKIPSAMLNPRGLLGDVLSYVRLFALGLSGGILAGVFNSLAVGMSPDNVIAGPIVMVLIFVIGHAINIFMNVLGAMVHPMRLTFVEFFKNSGYEGGGKEYKPFKK